MKTATKKAFFDASQCTYFRMSDVSPVVEDDAVILFEGYGLYRSWGGARASSHILIEIPDFLAAVVGFSHKHSGGQGWFYFETTPENPTPRRCTASQLTLDQRRLVYETWQGREAGLYWVKRPFETIELSTRRGAVEKQTVYKAVAVVNGEFLSIYDGSKWIIGKTRREACRPKHGGGFYAYGSPKDAAEAVFPKYSHLPNVPRVIIECEAWGKCEEYSNGKRAYTSIKPIRVIV